VSDGCCPTLPYCSFREDDDEGGDELGEDVNETSVAGGGKALGGRADVEARKKLRVSAALRAFLAHAGEIKKEDVGGGDDETVVCIRMGVERGS
jgi:hypothetical protein